MLLHLRTLTISNEMRILYFVMIHLSILVMHILPNNAVLNIILLHHIYGHPRSCLVCDHAYDLREKRFCLSGINFRLLTI